MHWRLLLLAMASCIATAMASLTYEAKQLDGQSSVDGTQVMAEFSFTNTGTNSILIKSIQTSCGCTTATSDKTEYPPGEKGSIKAVYKTNATSSLSQKVILVQTDDPSSPIDQLLLRVATPGSVSLDPSSLLWAQNEKPTAKKIAIHMKDGVVAVTGVNSPSPDFVATLKTIAPGKEYEVSVVPANTTQPKSATILIETNLPGMKKTIAATVAVRSGQ